MIEFTSLNDFEIKEVEKIRDWLSSVVLTNGKDIGDINYIFCDDTYLHKLNVEFLNHDTLTDVISFDYTAGDIVSGDVYISTERVQENALIFDNSFDDELNRVMVHGLLHYLGYKDKEVEEKKEMRRMEDLYLGLR